MQRPRFALIAAVALLSGSCRDESADDAIDVTIHVDAKAAQGELKPIWRFFGYDEANYSYLPGGEKLLDELGQLGADVFVRCHGLLVTGDGTPALKWASTNAYTEDAGGQPIYDFTIVDRIFDTYRQRGLRPYVQIGFMPKALSSHPDPYQHHWKPGDPYGDILAGWAYPPKDYGKWQQLVRTWVSHAVDRYGQAEVERWYWEVWNEPNGAYWLGRREEYFELYDHAVAGVRAALPTAKVGGPELFGADEPFLRGFVEHCLHGTNYATGQTGAPLDFISFHAKGAPAWVDGHVRMGIGAELSTVDSAFAILASYPELKQVPVVIGEADPDGCAACPSSLYPQNAYRNGTLYASYTAASFTRIQDAAARHGVVLEGALTWAFEFEDQPYFAGLRALATQGIDLPIFNLFRLYSQMRGQRVAVESSQAEPLEAIRDHGVAEAPEVSGLAAVDGNRTTVLVWHYHDDLVPGPDARVTLTLKNLPPEAKRLSVEEYRIDEDHANAFAQWQRMGSPAAPTAEEKATLERAGHLAAPRRSATTSTNGSAQLRVRLPRQAVSLLVIGW